MLPSLTRRLVAILLESAFPLSSSGARVFSAHLTVLACQDPFDQANDNDEGSTVGMPSSASFPRFDVP